MIPVPLALVAVVAVLLLLLWSATDTIASLRVQHAAETKRLEESVAYERELRKQHWDDLCDAYDKILAVRPHIEAAARAFAAKERA